MFFNSPQPTQFDLHWRMFGVDVRVHPMFWVMSAVLGWDIAERDGLLYVLLWMLCVFASILLHEMGHVCMGWLFGVEGHVVLHAFGGLTIPDREARRRWQRILVDLGGCLFQFAFVAALLVVVFLVLPAVHFRGVGRQSELLSNVINYLFFINLFWPLFNLLPIWPLDGGQITREVSEGISPDRGRIVSLGLSVAVAGCLAVYFALEALHIHLVPFLEFGGWFTAIFFALMAVSSYQLLQAEMNRGRRWHDEERLPWE